MSYTSEVMADGPIVYYEYDETSGGPIADSSGNGIVGNIGPSIFGYRQPGPITSDSENYALGWSAPDFLQLNDNPVQLVGDVFTAEVWVKRSAASGVEENLFDWGGNSFHVRIQPNNTILLSKRTVADIVQSTTTIIDTFWHHVVVTKNGSATNIYIDTINRTGTVSNATLTNESNDRFIGSDFEPSDYFIGTMARPAVYPTALSQVRINAHYTAAFSANPIAALPSSAMIVR